MIRALIIAALALDPIASAYVAAWWHDVPAERLLAICRRESRCSRIGAHESDAHLDGWGGQVRLGHLDPRCQAHGGRPYRWTTRGPWGLSAASHWPYLPRCYQPEWLDVPIVSAMIAAQKYRRLCLNRDASPGWCGGRKAKRARDRGETPWDENRSRSRSVM